ncbi:hypothetical protein ACFV2N_46550 [Streptomyces sp. NPDC059680]|uniref:hypothetical protein n=1 Tax=Streptomyces sp. NPDC059680 TaxID=3346904 RepID=UPI00368080B7
MVGKSMQLTAASSLADAIMTGIWFSSYAEWAMERAITTPSGLKYAPPDIRVFHVNHCGRLAESDTVLNGRTHISHFSTTMRALTQTFTNLDSKFLEFLQSSAYRIWHLPPRTPGRAEQLIAVAEALIHLRRTGKVCYRVQAHARRNATEYPLNTSLLMRSRETAIPVGSSVCITGEKDMCAVAYRTFCQELDEAFPAPWYVVAAPHLQQLRAHGADEVEVADASHDFA